MSLRLRPTTITEAKAFVARHHRHSEPPVSAFFAVGGCRWDDREKLLAVVIVGRPVGRGLDDGWTCEATRLCTDGTYNTCTLLYGAAARAAKSLGYQSIITYTKDDEPGTSLEAAGWEREADIPADTWNRPNRHRVQRDMFGHDRRPPGPKVRWRKWLVKSRRQRTPRARLRGKAS